MTREQGMASDDRVAVSKTKDNTIIFAPPDPSVGLIFYPGGKVEYTAYNPLMRATALNSTD